MTSFLKVGLASLLLVPLLAQAHGPSRQKVEESIIINASPAVVWDVVRDPTMLSDWHPGVKTSYFDNKMQTVTLNCDKKSVISKELLRQDHEKMLMQYKITNMTTLDTIQWNSQDFEMKVWPVSTYKSWLTVTPEGEGSKVTWKGKFYRAFMLNPPTPPENSDKDAVKAVQDFYSVGLEGLKAHIELPK